MKTNSSLPRFCRFGFQMSSFFLSVSSIKELKESGWTAVSCFSRDSLNWECVFGEAFMQNGSSKIAAGHYRTEKGVSVGYRDDGEREFFETRLKHDGSVEPNFPEVLGYADTVRLVYKELSVVGTEVLRGIANYLEIDARYLLDLTDLEFHGKIPVGNSLRLSKLSERDDGLEFSSSLLRICNYQHSKRSDDLLAFGAHTDSSFITIAPVSSNAGLEIFDQRLKRWVRPETDLDPGKAIVFVGEFLQLLTKSRFKAAVHRVVYNHNHMAMDRVSCPFLIRGRHEMVINIHDSRYNHPGGAEAVGNDNMADLDGITVKTMHKLLDLKRQKCFREHDNGIPHAWVLSAFPTEDVID